MAECMPILADWCRPSQCGWASTFTRNSWLIGALLQLSRFTVGDFGLVKEQSESRLETNLADGRHASALKSSFDPVATSSLKSFSIRASCGRESDLHSFNTLSDRAHSCNPKSTTKSPSFNSGTPSYISQLHLSNPGSRSKSTPASLTSSKSHPSPKSKVPISCPYCLKSYSTVSARNKHLKERCKTQKREMFECSFGCGYKAPVKWNVRNLHEKNHCPRRRSR
jgi:hypothetical protein